MGSAFDCSPTREGTGMSSMIDDLLHPSALPDKTRTVSIVQTHISLVIVGDRFVYKIKKPVDFGFLDFTTLDKRRYYCEQEVKLNRRLSEGLYIGVLRITYDGVSHKLGNREGETVDYAVKMKRIPDDALMKSIFYRGDLQEDHLKTIATTLARFHKTAAQSAEIDRFGTPEMFKINTDENFAQTEKYIGTTLDQNDFRMLKEWTADFYATNRDLFMKRIQDKRIRDCHGDLHMEHISIGDKLYIFDCIEFNDRMRYSDTLCDIAFLVMDLEYHGGKGYAVQFWRYYSEMAGEADVDNMLTFYKVYRAYVRGKVTSFQLDDENISNEEKERALSTAGKYFKLARSYI